MRQVASPRWLLPILAIVVVAVAVGGGFFYRAQRQAVRASAEADLLTIAALKVDQIVAWRAERVGDGAVLAEDPIWTAVVARWLADADPALRERLLSRFRELAEHYRYTDVGLVDPTGRTRLSLSGRAAPGSTPILEGVAEAVRQHRTVLVGLHTNPDGRAPSMEVIAPLHAIDGGGRTPVGAFVLTIDARRFLYPLVQTWPRPSETAETLLVRRDGDHVLFLNELRHQDGTALVLRIPMSREDLPAVMAVRGQEGIVEGVDYRGVDVLAALRAVPGSPWFMVAKVDRSEFLAGWRSRSLLILALLAGLVVAAVAAVGVVWQRSRREHFEALFEAESALRAVEARHHATLMSLAEGVIVADGRGVVELMNPAAERLSGWSTRGAVGRPLAEVLPLVDESTREALPGPVERVLHGRADTESDSRSLLVTRDGRETAVAESVAPIRDERGALVGVVAVFRDQTEERLARRFNETRLGLVMFAASHTLEELLRRAVDEVAAFAGSPIGFFHFVEPDQRTLSLQQWSTRTVEEFCSAEGRGLHYDVEEAGVWTDCIAARRPVVHNDYRSLPHRKGLPEGHAEVIRELVVPVLRDDRVVAILGVGNKPVDYTSDDVEIVSYLADVTWQIVEQKRTEEAIREMAYHDPLTGLPNRLLLDDRLRVAMSVARRGHDSLSLMVVDLDRFKDVNDSLGHGVGDAVLRLAGARLTGLVRETDTVARIGGDEFCLLLTGLSDVRDVVHVAEKIVRAFEEPVVADGVERRVTVSVGVAVFPWDGADGEQLMRSADRAMYRAKRAGRSTYRCSSEPPADDSLISSASGPAP